MSSTWSNLWLICWRPNYGYLLEPNWFGFINWIICFMACLAWMIIDLSFAGHVLTWLLNWYCSYPLLWAASLHCRACDLGRSKDCVGLDMYASLQIALTQVFCKVWIISLDRTFLNWSCLYDVVFSIGLGPCLWSCSVISWCSIWCHCFGFNSMVSNNVCLVIVLGWCTNDALFKAGCLLCYDAGEVVFPMACESLSRTSRFVVRRERISS